MNGVVVRLANGSIDYVTAESVDSEIHRLTRHKTHWVRMYWTPRNVLVDVLRSFNGERVLSYLLAPDWEKS